MQGLIEECDIILELPGVELWEISQNSSRLVQRGVLQILEFKAYGCYIIQINSFKYSLSKEIPILARKESDNITTYILPNLQGHYGIRIQQNEPQIMEVLDIIFTQQATLYYQEDASPQTSVTPTGYSNGNVGWDTPTGDKEPAKQRPASSGSNGLAMGVGAGVAMGVGAGLDNGADSSSSSRSTTKSSTFTKITKVAQEVKVVATNTAIELKKTKITTEKVSNALQTGGGFLKNGMIKVAEKVSGGIKSGGSYISTKIVKKKEIKEVSPSMMGKLKIAKTATGAALTFTKVQVQGIIEVGSAIASELGRNFEDSETGKKLAKNSNYEKAKEIGKSTVYATACVIDGMVEALCIMGRGVSEATTEVVTAKYGDQVGEATKDGLDCVGNVGLMARAYTVEGAKAIEKKTENKDLKKKND